MINAIGNAEKISEAFLKWLSFCLSVSGVFLRSYLMVMFIMTFFFQEYQPCNTNACPELKKTTPWTPWTPVNISDNGGHYEQRFRYTCKARLPDPNLLEVGRQRIEMRYCSSDGTSGCSTDGEQSETGSPCPLLVTCLQFHFRHRLEVSACWCCV